jgi:multisubunit Na+/H+ antiporter MnhC subunit
MKPILYLHTAVALRWAELRRADERDRGDSPVPTAVIILGMVVIAMAVTAFVFTRTNEWLNGIPTMQQPAGN